MSMTTQTPDAVREAAEEARDLLKTAQMASDGRRVTLHPTRVRLVSNRLAAALDSRAGDAGEIERIGAAIVADLQRQSALQRGCFVTDEDEAGGAVVSTNFVVAEIARAVRAALSAIPAPAVDAVPAGEDACLPNRPGHCSECGYSRKHAADCSHKREGAIHANRT